METSHEFKSKAFRINWFRDRLNGKLGKPNTVKLITKSYMVYIANSELRLLGNGFSKSIDLPLKYFIMKDGKIEYYNSIEFLGYLPYELRKEFPANCQEILHWEADYYIQNPPTSEDLRNLFKE